MLTKKQVREHSVSEKICIYFDEEFGRSFYFKVIGKMIDDYLNDTSLKTINALYHKYRVELLIDKSVECKLKWRPNRAYLVWILSRRKR